MSLNGWMTLESQFSELPFREGCQGRFSESVFSAGWSVGIQHEFQGWYSAL